MNDFENDQYTEQFTSFEFEQDSFNTIHFGRNLKGRNHSNILFDEIDELALYSQISVLKVHLT